MPRSPIPTHRIPDCPLAERQWAAATVSQVPLDGAFDALARQQLVDWALEGYEVDAYQHRDNEWVLWIRTSDPQDEMRWQPHEWATAWRAATDRPPSSTPEAAAALSMGLLAVPLVHPVPPILLALLFVVYAAAVVVWRPWRARKRKGVA